MDILIPITGIKGSGKSTLALQLLRIYLERYFPNYSLVKDMEKFVVFDNQQVEQNLLNEDEYLPLNIDEAYRCMASEDWAKVESKYLKKIFAQIRVKHRVIFACLPDFWWLDKKYREDMVIFWLHVIGRGIAILFTADLSIGCEDKWHRKEFQKIKEKSSQLRRIDIFTPPEKIIELYKKHPCFLDILTFPKCDEYVYSKYLELRKAALLKQTTEKPEDLIDKRIGLKDLSKVIKVYQLRQQGKSFFEIGREVGINERTALRWCHLMGIS